MLPDPDFTAAMAAAQSPAWAERAAAAEQLARWADDQAASPSLQRLLLDTQDTAVTDAACQALLDRGDIHAIRLVALAVATADDEQLDHLHAMFVRRFLPEGPDARFQELFLALAQDPNERIRQGASQLTAWTAPWTSAE